MPPLPQQAKELHAAHYRHIPIEQDHVGHLLLATRQGFLAVAGFLDLELERLENVPSDLSDHLRVIDDQTAFHARTSHSNSGLVKG